MYYDVIKNTCTLSVTEYQKSAKNGIVKALSGMQVPW